MVKSGCPVPEHSSSSVSVRLILTVLGGCVRNLGITKGKK